MDTNTEKKPRYSVSRKGMGGAPVKYQLELLQEIMDLKSKGVSVKKTCEERGLPYVSINAALKRVGLKVKRVKQVNAETVEVSPAGTTTPLA